MISGGEPTLVPSLLATVEKLAKLQVKIEILTNLSAPVELYQQLQAFSTITSSLHYSQCNAREFFDKVIELAGTRLKIYVLAEHQYFTESIISFNRLTKISSNVELRPVDSDEVSSYTDSYTAQQLDAIYDRDTSVNGTNSFTAHVLKELNKKDTSICNAGFTNIHIDNDGKIYPCQEIKKSMGTIYDKVKLTKTICTLPHCFCDYRQIPC
jgi:MoaA/NifB/PqqE/SkfB family radical SAM enzyme